MLKRETKLVDLKIDRWLATPGRSWLFIIDGKRVFVPQSIGEFSEEDSEVTVPEWWAIKNELV